MRAGNVMTRDVITVGPDADVRSIARKLLEHRISAVPVVDEDSQLLGIVSEGDLVMRPENETAGRTSWWLELFGGFDSRCEDFVKKHGRRAQDVMTRNVVSVTEDTALSEIAKLLERHRIKRVPVLRKGRVVGIVSRANLLHGLAAAPATQASLDSTQARASIYKLLGEAGLRTSLLNIVVSEGTAHLWGATRSWAEREAVRVAAEAAPGVERVENHLVVVSKGPE
jgi:CBS domain-containing protein